MLKRVKINIESRIENFDGQGNLDGERETTSASHVGAMKISGKEISLSYRENTEGGSVFSDILLHESGAVTVRRSGAISSTMHFNEKEEYNTVYSLPPYKFDMTIKTNAIKSSLSIFGGTLDIDYEMKLGGADKRVLMKIKVSEDIK